MLPKPDLENDALRALEMVGTHAPRRRSSGTVDVGNDGRLYDAEYSGTKRPYDEYNDQTFASHSMILESERPRPNPAPYQLLGSPFSVYEGQSTTAAATRSPDSEHPQHVLQHSPALENKQQDGDDHTSEEFPPYILPESPYQVRGFQATAVLAHLQQPEPSSVFVSAYEENADLVPCQKAWSSSLISHRPIETYVLYKPRPQVDPATLRYFRSLQQGPIGDDIELRPLTLGLPPGSGPKFPPMEPPARTGRYWMEERWFVENSFTLDNSLKLRDEEGIEKD